MVAEGLIQVEMAKALDYWMLTSFSLFYTCKGNLSHGNTEELEGESIWALGERDGLQGKELR